MTCSDRPGTSTCLLHQQEHVRVHKTITGATWRHQDLTSRPGTNILLKCNRNLIFYSRRFKKFSAVNPVYVVTSWLSKRKENSVSTQIHILKMCFSMVCLSIFFCCSLQVEAPAIHVVHVHCFSVGFWKKSNSWQKGQDAFPKVAVAGSSTGLSLFNGPRMSMIVLYLISHESTIKWNNLKNRN